jgi:hypothetical protein
MTSLAVRRFAAALWTLDALRLVVLLVASYR